jgi:hypothetical protein
VLPFNHDRRMSWSAPCVREINPDYLRNKPTSWSTGFVHILFRQDRRFNLYPIIVIDGEFSYGGKL